MSNSLPQKVEGDPWDSRKIFLPHFPKHSLLHVELPALSPTINIIVLPVKNVTWILMAIPCHFISQLDSTAVWSKSTPNSMTIPCHSSRFYLFSMLKYDMDFAQVQVIDFHGICYENGANYSGIGLIFEPN